MHQYWGKAETEQGQLKYLSIWEHSLNVAAVAKVWLEQRPLLLSRWTTLLGWDSDKTSDREPALRIALHCILLHDLGKYDWRFQAKVPELFNLLNQQEAKKRTGSFDHGGWGFHYYVHVRFDNKSSRKPSWLELIRATASHHGSYCPLRRQQLTPNTKYQNKTAQKAILAAITEHINVVEQLYPLPEAPPESIDPAPVVFLAGLCSVADWLGSNKDIFTFRSVDDAAPQPEAITPEMEGKARQILRENDLLGKYSGVADTRIEKILGRDDDGQLHQPYPLQYQALEMPLTEAPQLMIIEAPMGEGKTEAAMLLAHRLLEMGGTDNLYFALPTMATSNAMFDRMQKMMEGTAFFDQESSLVLAHGKRDLREAFTNSIIQDTAEGDQESENLSALKMCNAFFASSHKRSLLANAGVGTVDQAMSAVLGASHHWVKLFGLSNSILIIDEVHAYDAYMLRILERLLQWLKALGTHVILLSATLTVATKTKLVEAFVGEIPEPPASTSTITPMNYPLMTHVYTKGNQWQMNLLQSIPIKELKRKVNCKWITDKERIIESLITFAEQGAQVCLILNTVAKAQQFFDELSGDTRTSNISLLLFHSRFQLIDRNVIEGEVIKHFGKRGHYERGKEGRILVATQVVEQSLDVDFDVMVSEVAPMDLLLQRIGRLHRHLGNNKLRKKHPWKDACLFVYSPCQTVSEWLDDRKSNENARSVYDAFVLYRTALLFHHRNYEFAIQLPDDLRSLVEEVYTETEEMVLPKDQEKYEEALLNWKNSRYNQQRCGAEVIQPSPDDKPKRLGRCVVRESESCELEEELEVGGTRLAAPSLQIFFVDAQWTLSIDGRERGNQSYLEFKRRLQNHSVTVLETMLTSPGRGCLQSADFDPTTGWITSEEWEETLDRFEREFPFEPKPLILPLAHDAAQEVEYHFNQGDVVLQYSKKMGLKICK